MLEDDLNCGPNQEFPDRWTFQISGTAAALLAWRPRPAFQWALQDACACQYGLRSLGMFLRGLGMSIMADSSDPEAELARPGGEMLPTPANARYLWIQLFEALSSYVWLSRTGHMPESRPDRVRALAIVLSLFEAFAAGQAPMADLRLACYMLESLRELRPQPGPSSLEINL